MAGSEQEIRRELDTEREHLAEDIESLRATARAKLPVVALGIAGVVFVLSGGLRRTTKLLLRRR